jgi:hypothetical protein
MPKMVANLENIFCVTRKMVPAGKNVFSLSKSIVGVSESLVWERLYGYRPLLLETLVEHAH